MANYLDNYNRWLTSDKLSDAERAELLSIKDDDKEIQLRFTDYLSFAAPARGVRPTRSCAASASRALAWRLWSPSRRASVAQRRPCILKNLP